MSKSALLLALLLLTTSSARAEPIAVQPALVASQHAFAVLFAVGVELDNPQSAVEAGAEALGSSWKYPWYEDSTDNIRPLEIKPPAPPRPPRQPRNWGNWDFSWLTSPFSGNNFSVLGYILIAALLILLGYIVFRIYQEHETQKRRRAREQAAAAQRRGHADRVEALPFDLELATHDLMSEARRQYHASNYNQAIIYLYSHELVELDKHDFLHLTKGKTNREYLWEVGRSSPLGQILEETMLLFERAFFGHHTITKEEFDRCWNELPEFNRLLTRSHEAVAV